MAELIKSKSSKNSFLLHLNGYLFYKNGGKIGETSYWKCRNNCGARAIIKGGPDNIEVKKDGHLQDPTHGPNPEEVEAERVITGMKRAAEEHPEAPPSQIVRTALRGVTTGVLAELPERINLRKGISRIRLRNMPSNPTRMEDLEEIPTEFRKTLSGETFLLFDSYEEDDNGNGRIIIYATVENLKNLFKSNVWFVDGTFKCSPSIFYQVFAIMGSINQITARETRSIGMPYVYSLLENKTEDAYRKVFDVILEKAQEHNITIKLPSVVMTDFEVGIINAAKSVIGANTVRCCLFHLAQAVYRRVQSEGLQQQYADPEDSSIRDAARLLIALAYLPSEDIEKGLEAVEDDMPDELKTIYDYFERTYVRNRVRRGRGRPRIVAPRYSPQLWSHYDSVIQGTARTNNISEGWHNHLQVVIGKDHPSFYNFLVELQKEQADVEILIRQLQLGQKIRKYRDPKRKKIEEKIANIVSKYNEYIENNDILTYLKSLSYNIKM